MRTQKERYLQTHISIHTNVNGFGLFSYVRNVNKTRAERPCTGTHGFHSPTRWGGCGRQTKWFPHRVGSVHPRAPIVRPRETHEHMWYIFFWEKKKCFKRTKYFIRYYSTLNRSKKTLGQKGTKRGTLKMATCIGDRTRSNSEISIETFE